MKRVLSLSSNRLFVSCNCPGTMLFMLKECPMSVMQGSEKSFVTVSEMAELCRLSRSRFYDLMDQGVFPKPALQSSSKHRSSTE